MRRPTPAPCAATKPDPGNANVERIDAKIAAGNRRHEALNSAVTNIEDELVDLRDANRRKWATDAAEASGGARTAFLEKLDELEAARLRVVQALVLERWVQRFPEGKCFVLADPTSALTSPAGDPYRAGELIAALVDVGTVLTIDVEEPVGRATPADLSKTLSLG